MIDTLNGIPVVVCDSLPLEKSEVNLIQRGTHVTNREYFIDDGDHVWGFIDDIGFFNKKIHLSRAVFEKIKNKNLKSIK